LGEDKSNNSSLKDELLIREKPLVISPDEIQSSVASPGDIDRLLQCALPNPMLPKYPLSYLYHAIRLWGSNANFPNVQFLNPVVQSHWGNRVFAALFDETIHRELSSPFGKSIFAPSKFGLQILTASDLEWAKEFSSTHPGTYLQVLSELGTSSHQKILLADGTSYSVRDVIIDTARRVHPHIEPEWNAVALACYLKATEWRNRFGQLMSFNAISSQLISRDFGKGSCFGTHAPYALACMHKLHSTAGGQSLISKSISRAVRERLKETSSFLAGKQANDGSWGANWFQADSPSRKDKKSDSLMDSLGNIPGLEDILKITVTGHHLEWMAIAQSHCRPSASVIDKAIRFLLTTIPRYRRNVVADWHLYLPFSHAVKAICDLHGMKWPVFPTISPADGHSQGASL